MRRMSRKDRYNTIDSILDILESAINVERYEDEDSDVQVVQMPVKTFFEISYSYTG